jgi:perosamine synthetase
MRRENAAYMSERLSKIEALKTPTVPDRFFHVYQLYTIRLMNNSVLRNDLLQYLLEKGIMTKVYFFPVHLTQFYRQQFGYSESYLPLTEKVASEVLTLPMYPTLTKEEINYIAQSIEDFFEKEVK